jgi:hypothetical protein
MCFCVQKLATSSHLFGNTHSSNQLEQLQTLIQCGKDANHGLKTQLHERAIRIKVYGGHAMLFRAFMSGFQQTCVPLLADLRVLAGRTRIKTPTGFDPDFTALFLPSSGPTSWQSSVSLQGRQRMGLGRYVHVNSTANHVSALTQFMFMHLCKYLYMNNTWMQGYT